jgi:DNA-binding IclR family transcriptional regulator
VFDSSGNLALAITAMGPADSFDPGWEGETAQKVRACAAAISQRLGSAAG